MADMTAAVAKMTTAVERDKSVNDGAITLLGQLSTALRNNASDPTAINALADQLDASQQALADAIVANTPAEAAVGSSQGQRERTQGRMNPGTWDQEQHTRR